MDFENNIFPRLNSRVLPGIIAQIFLHVNSYMKNATNMRLISRGWRDFVDQEILQKPNLKTKMMKGRELFLVHSWTTKPSRQSTLVVGSMAYKVSISGDLISVWIERGRTLVYRNLLFVGFAPTHAYFVSWGDELVSLTDFYNERTMRFKVYRNRTMAQDAAGEQPRQPKRVKTCTDMRLMPHSKASNISLQGRHILGLKSLGKTKLILVCIERTTNNITIANLIDDSEKIITQSRPTFTFQKLQLWTLDSKELVISWEGGFLQLIDHVKGEEVWARDQSAQGDAISKSSRLTCLFSREYHPARAVRHHCAVQVYDNRTGDLLKRVSHPGYVDTRFTTATDDTIRTVMDSAVWTARETDGSHIPTRCKRIRVFNAKEDRLSEMAVCACAEDCRNATADCHVKALRLAGVVGGRILLAASEHSCGMSSLACYDLLDLSGPVTLDRHYKGRYTVDVAHGRVLCWSSESNTIRVLAFSQTP